MSTYRMAAVHAHPVSPPEVHHYVATGEDSISLRFHGANVFTTNEQDGSRCEQRIESARATVFLSPEQARDMANGILAALARPVEVAA